jgi:hypothetical protein
MPKPTSLRLCTLLCLLALLSGCSLQLAYRFLDWGLSAKLRHYIDLNDQQADTAKAAITRFHHWHQAQELPRYAAQLAQWQTRLQQPQPFTHGELLQFQTTLESLYKNSLQQLLPSIAQLAASLSPEQREHLVKQLAKDRKKYAKIYIDVDAEELSDTLYSDMHSYLKTYLGKLTADQQAQLTLWSRQLKPFGQAVQNEQLRWQERLLQLLAKNLSATELQSPLSQLMLADLTDWTPENRAIIEHNQTHTDQLLLQLLNNLTSKQRQHLIKQLHTWEEDCRSLAAQIPAST